MICYFQGHLRFLQNEHRIILIVLSNLPLVPLYLILNKLPETHYQINRGAIENKDQECGHGVQILASLLTS